MRLAGHDCLSSSFPRGIGDAGIICSHDDLVSDFHVEDALPYADDEGSASEEAKGLLGESDRSEARRNHYQRAHASPEIARLDAKVTPVNIALCRGWREHILTCLYLQGEREPEGELRLVGVRGLLVAGVDAVLDLHDLETNPGPDVLDEIGKLANSR